MIAFQIREDERNTNERCHFQACRIQFSIGMFLRKNGLDNNASKKKIKSNSHIIQTGSDYFHSYDISNEIGREYNR
jgi:hypothetical protein